MVKVGPRECAVEMGGKRLSLSDTKGEFDATSEFCDVFGGGDVTESQI